MKVNDALYPIREVSNLTGVNSITLRAWERRYGLIEPVRTEGGHRLYTLEHIEQIKTAVKLTEEGIPISQVKARLSQMKTQDKEAVNLDDYDYESKLKEACQAFDLESLNAELDQAFMDVSDGLLFEVLVRLSKHFSHPSAGSQLVFWEAQLLPRLYTRLRHSTRHLALHAVKSLWLQGESEQDTHSILVMVGIRLAKRGIYPIISTAVEQDDAQLFDRIKQARCQGLVIVDSQQNFNEARWRDWVDVHPGLELHYFVEFKEDTELSKKVQCNRYDLA